MHRVLVVSSDAGGAFALLPVVRELVARGVQVHATGAGPALHIWERERLPCAWEGADDAISEADALDRIHLYGPDVLLVGAGTYNRIEHVFRRAAGDAGVFCFALLDAWFNLAPRFSREVNGALQSSVPDLIGVIDEPSYREMVAEGFDPEGLVIVGAPHVDETARLVRATEATGIERLRQRFGVSADVPTFVFFSADIADWDRLGPGQTQLSVLRELMGAAADACRTLGERVHLLVKPHPSEDAAPLRTAVQNPPGGDLLDCRVVEDCRSWELICVADAVFGIRSTTLLEAALCGRRAFSLQLGRDLRRYPDPHFGNRPGITSLHNAGECREVVRSILGRPPRLKSESAVPACSQATSRVIDAILARRKQPGLAGGGQTGQEGGRP